MDRLISKIITILFLITLYTAACRADILVPMDDTQSDHLKAYGLAYWALQPPREITVKWLLNYRGGSFLFPDNQDIISKSNIMGVSYEFKSPGQVKEIEKEIENNNMNIVLLEKAPKIAVYTPPIDQPWDDAVILALEYAEIPFDKIWDNEVLEGKLSEYDWLHLHHEDFTGQLGKFFAVFRHTSWYIAFEQYNLKTAKMFGYKTIPELKAQVALAIREYVERGGFLFAMCAATDTLDIALSAYKTDIVPQEIDGTPIDPNYAGKLDFSKTFAFEKFNIITKPEIYEYSDIDVSSENYSNAHEKEDFTLFEFAAKYDPVPTMLTQCHRRIIKGFLGQTTCFLKDKIKDNIIIMGEVKGENKAKYIHGTLGKGTFSFYGGHDPEDYAHEVYEAPTNLIFYKNSPGYRLILNNVLFPAAKKEKLKT
ncbi:asparagine synthetase B [bacterium]|nr:asparagine synthetase B [bacterium]